MLSVTIDTLSTIVDNLPLDAYTRVVVLISGRHCLRSLKRFTSLHWVQSQHLEVGGCTNISVWIGLMFKPLTTSLPSYCRTGLCDVLDFAPKDVKVFQISAPHSLVPHQASSPVSDSSHPHTYWSYGLLHATSVLTPHSAIYVNTTTPFTATGWC